RERTPVGVERTTNAERKCGEMLAVAQRQLVEHRHAERLQMLLEDVLERARAGPVGCLPQVAPVGVLHLAHDHSFDLLQLARGCQLCEKAVEVVRGQLDVLEEEDRAVKLDLPGCPYRLDEQPEAATH